MSKKITKEEFELLYDENITKKQYDCIISKIDARFYEICKMCLVKTNSSWFDYGNCGYERDPVNGFFDPNEYKEYIIIGGEGLRYIDGMDLSEQFPTRWLWEDFEEELKADNKADLAREEAKKQKAKQKREEKKIWKQKMIKQVKAKLTKEEFKFIRSKNNLV